MVTILHSLNKDFLAWLEPAQMLLYASQRQGDLHVANDDEALNWQVKAVLNSRHLNRWRLIVVVNEADLGTQAWAEFMAQIEATKPASQKVTVLMINAEPDSAAGLNLKALTKDLLPQAWTVIRLPDLINTAWYAPVKTAYLLLTLLENADDLSGEYYLLEDSIKLDESTLAQVFGNYTKRLEQAQKELAANPSEVAVRLHDESLKDIIPLRVNVPDSSDELLETPKPEVSWLQREDQRLWNNWQGELQSGLSNLKDTIKQEMQGFLVSRLERLERADDYQEPRHLAANSIEQELKQNEEKLYKQRTALEKSNIPELKPISQESWGKHQATLSQNLKHRPKMPHIVFSVVFATLAIAFSALWYSPIVLKSISLAFLALILAIVLYFSRRSITTEITDVVVGQESEVDEHLSQSSQNVLQRSQQSLQKLKLWVQGSNVQNLEVALLNSNEQNQKRRFHENALQQHMAYSKRILSALPKLPHSQSQTPLNSEAIEASTKHLQLSKGYIDNKIYSSIAKDINEVATDSKSEVTFHFGTQHRHLRQIEFLGLDEITLEEAR